MPRRGARASRGGTILIWAGLGLVLLFLYAPLVPPAVHSFADTTAGGAGPFQNYAAIFDDARLLRALQTSLVVGALVALIAPLLGDDEREQLKSERERAARMPGSRRRAIPVEGGQQARHGPEGHGSPGDEINTTGWQD